MNDVNQRMGIENNIRCSVVTAVSVVSVVIVTDVMLPGTSYIIVSTHFCLCRAGKIDFCVKIALGVKRLLFVLCKAFVRCLDCTHFGVD